MFAATVPWLIAYGLPATVSPVARASDPVSTVAALSVNLNPLELNVSAGSASPYSFAFALAVIVSVAAVTASQVFVVYRRLSTAFEIIEIPHLLNRIKIGNKKPHLSL